MGAAVRGRARWRGRRGRWALEEAGLAYRARPIDADDQVSADDRARQPFGQVLVFEEDDLVRFESGSIVLKIEALREALLPDDETGGARTVSWLFPALNSIEVVIRPLAEIDFFYAAEAWAELHRPDIEKAAKGRLAQLAAWLGDRDHLEDRFTVGDRMMTALLRILWPTDLLDSEPKLKAYQARCEARPAFQGARRDQRATFEQR